MRKEGFSTLLILVSILGSFLGSAILTRLVMRSSSGHQIPNVKSGIVVRERAGEMIPETISAFRFGKVYAYLLEEDGRGNVSARDPLPEEESLRIARPDEARPGYASYKDEKGDVVQIGNPIVRGATFSVAQVNDDWTLFVQTPKGEENRYRIALTHPPSFIRIE